MEVIGNIGNWALGSHSCNFFTTNFFNGANAKICSELSPRLSPDASIIFPGNPLFKNATMRWQTWEEPKITVVVEVSTESDVEETIKFANGHDVPFLAKSGGHGAISNLGGMHHGIEILMRKMNSITIAPDGESATIGGGALAKNIVDTLWVQNKQTVTGCCECVSAIGPMLGGGHGFLQGYHGLIGDNLLSARVVLANGTAVTVSNDSHPDLFWALRGAGHNFGIVTEFTHKIYEVPPNDKWATRIYIFTGDKVEEHYQKCNDLATTQSPALIQFSVWLWSPAIDTKGPVIITFLLYHGPESELDKYAASFDAIGSAVPVDSKLVDYTELASLTFNGNDGIACGHGSVSLRFPIGIQKYNPEAMREAYNKFTKVTTEFPALNGSFALFEGYSVQGVKAVPEKSTAFPHRQDNLLIAPVMVYAPNITLNPIAIQAGKDMRKTFYDGEGAKEFHAYVNYAHGDESLKQLYGYEDWRQEKLKQLKKLYDPKGRFSFYAPIAERGNVEEEL